MTYWEYTTCYPCKSKYVQNSGCKYLHTEKKEECCAVHKEISCRCAEPRCFICCQSWAKGITPQGANLGCLRNESRGTLSVTAVCQSASKWAQITKLSACLSALLMMERCPSTRPGLPAIPWPLQPLFRLVIIPELPAQDYILSKTDHCQISIRSQHCIISECLQPN